MLIKKKPNLPCPPAAIEVLGATHPTAPPAPGSGEAPADGPSILINHGIHSGNYPVVGMTVAQARRVLAGILDIDPGSIAVIQGQRIEDENARVITAADQIISFVKESSIKGAAPARAPGIREGAAVKPRASAAQPGQEGIVLHDGTAELHLPPASVQKVPLQRFLDAVNRAEVRGLDPEPFPDNLKWKMECGPLAVYMLELKPELRWIRWVGPDSPEPFGPEAHYETYRLATPFTVLKVPFLDGKVQPRCEIFYRNEPLAALSDRLFWPNLLNVSPHSYGCTAWLCTQFLGHELAAGRRPGRRGVLHGLDAVMKHLWGGGFNGSSEEHEGQSCFTKAMSDGVDPRVTSVERWQAESIRDPSFVLRVEWKPAVTVEELLRAEIASWRLDRKLADTAELIGMVLAGGKKEKGEVEEELALEEDDL